MSDKYCVYRHTCPNGKVYIGITKQKPEARFQNGNGYKECPYFYSAILKYGWANIKHEILVSGLESDFASEEEKKQITIHKSNNPQYGYNLTSGGFSAFMLSDIGKIHRSEALKRLWENEEFRRKKIESMTGKNNKMYGVKMSAESRKKMSDAAKKRPRKPMSEEAKQKLSNIRKEQGNFRAGKHHSEETKRKISESNKGKKVVVTEETKMKISLASKGVPKSEEAKQHMREAQRAIRLKRAKKVEKRDLVNGSLIKVYDSVIDAAIDVRAPGSSLICRCCKGKTKKAYGYYWRYAD